MTKIIEVTEANEKDYLSQIATLEEVVMQKMIEEGKEGQLFTTGEEDISEYIHSEENTVIVAVNEKNEVLAATYITQGQRPFTYNDITKYFKVGDGYREDVKLLYGDNQMQYKYDLLETYSHKIDAYEYAKRKIYEDAMLEEHPEYENIEEFLETEIQDKNKQKEEINQYIKEYLEKEIQENGFHEKSDLREKINQYMSEYIYNNYGKKGVEDYEHFYWTTAEEVSKDLNMPIPKNSKIRQNIEDYETILEKGKLLIHEQPSFDEKQYYTANTENSIELDTYITAPDSRNSGLTSQIVFEGIKKHISKFFENPENQEIFLCSTLHRENTSSRYVSEFFGLKDSLFVNRRQGRDREVHICRITREEVPGYLEDTENRIQDLLNSNQRKNMDLDDSEGR